MVPKLLHFERIKIKNDLFDEEQKN